MAQANYKMVCGETEVPNVKMYGELLKQLEEGTDNEPNPNGRIKPMPKNPISVEKINNIVGYLCVMFAVQMGVICCTLWIIERNTNEEQRLMMAVTYLIPAVMYFIATSVLTVSTSHFHDSFPCNVVILTLELSGLAVIFLLQVLRFGLERSKLSDIPAVRFAFLCCVLISAVSFAVAKLAEWQKFGFILRLSMATFTMIVTLLGYRLYEEFRFLPLLLLFFVLLYVVWRAEALAAENKIKRPNKHSSDDEVDSPGEFAAAVYIALQVLFGPLVLFTGLFSMSLTILRPQHPWT